MITIENVEQLTFQVGRDSPLGAMLAGIFATGGKVATGAAAPLGAQGGEAVQTTARASTPPAIGTRWLERGGVYAGISRGVDGEGDAHLVLLDATPGKPLKWADAVKWAEDLGDGARLPTRFESALLYANVQDQMDTDKWHWTGTQFSDSSAWGQYFYDGSQSSYSKSYAAAARAVRRFPL